jgi:hypothetical protein
LRHRKGWIVLIVAGILILAAGIVADRALPKPPQIARAVITGEDWSQPRTGSRKFTVVLNRQFPPGTDAGAMVSALRSQGFEFPPPARPNCIPESKMGEWVLTAKPGDSPNVCPSYDPRRTLNYQWGWFPCAEFLRVEWTADEPGRITKIMGSYSNACV